MNPGLVSISFRKLSPAEILRLCEKSGLQCIEWGGDIHVPAGDVKRAKEVAAMTAACGMKTAAYGSYFRLGQPDDDFRRNLDCACELQAPVLRIWAGLRGSRECTAEERLAWTEQLGRLAQLGKTCGITVAPEYHINTLTDEPDSVRQLMKDLPEQQFYWQPRWDRSEAERLNNLAQVADRLTHIHVFTWRIENGREIRLPLSEGEHMWQQVIAEQPDDRCALMEFVQEDDPDNLIRDAAVFRSWLR